MIFDVQTEATRDLRDFTEFLRVTEIDGSAVSYVSVDPRMPTTRKFPAVALPILCVYSLTKMRKV